MKIIFAFTIPMFLAWLTVTTVRRYASRIGLIAVPNERSLHELDKPNGGGLGIVVGGTVVGFWLAFVYQSSLLVVVGAAMLIAVVGLRDDIQHVSALTRLAIQMFACAIMLANIGSLPPLLTVTIGTHDLTNPISILILFFAGVWWINLYNFMDGIDGIAGLQGLFMMAVSVVIGIYLLDFPGAQIEWLWMLGLSAAIIGFLAHNWPPAKIFMGDVGSTYLAFMIYALALLSVEKGWMSYPTWLILSALFVVDATITLLQRAWRGERLYEAHRSHAYQRLTRHLRSHRSVVLTAFTINILFLLPLAVASMLWSEAAWAFVLIAYTPLVVVTVFIDKMLHLIAEH